MGMMNSSMILYPEQIILDSEMALNVKETYKKFEFKEFDVSLGVIKSVGPRGHFLREKHTRSHIRDFHYSPIFHQKDNKGNLREPRDIAFEEFKKIYDTHQPEPLPDTTLKELDKILISADRIAENLGA